MEDSREEGELSDSDVSNHHKDQDVVSYDIFIVYWIYITVIKLHS